MTEQRQLKARVRARMVRTGESYAAARRHVVGTADGADGAGGYQFLGGRHPETAAVTNALANLGVTYPGTGDPLSEAMILGIGGGLGAGYILWEFDDGARRVVTTGFRNRWQYPQKWLPEVGLRLGLTVDLQETGGTKKAEAQLADAMADDRPVVTAISAGDVGYWHLPADQSGWMGYPVVVYGRTDDGYLVDDRNLAPLTIAEETLTAARGRISSYKNRLLVIDAPAEELSEEDLASAIRDGLADQLDHLSSSSASFGLPAFDKWAKMLTASSAKAWPKVFADGRSLLGALVSTVEAIDEVGILGGNLRELYAQFCREAGPIIGTDLGGPGDAYQQASDAWAAVVDVVGRVEPVGAVVDADRRRRQAVARGDAGSEDARAAAEASEDLLAADETGLDPEARADLFAEMAEAIGAAAQAERDALDELRAAVDAS